MLSPKRAIVRFMAGGGSRWDADAFERILNKSPEQTALDDLLRLSKADLLCVFHWCHAPNPAKMDGEFEARLVPAGALAGVAAFYTHRLFGPGRWVGKAFRPDSDRTGQGYNLFRNDAGIRRTCRMRTCLGPSRFDGKPSLHLDYAPFNRFLNRTMFDEIRRVHGELFLGLGCMSISGGTVNSAPFVLTGRPAPWVGPDAG